MKKCYCFIILLFCNMFCLGRTYTSISDLPNYKNVYTLPEGDKLEITGDLTVSNNMTLVISAGSIFDVNGNLTIDEKGTLQLSSNSKTVVRGNLYQDGHSPLGWGLIRVDIGDIQATEATVVVTGNYTIWHGIEYSQGSYLDDGEGNEVYIFGSSDVSGLGNESDFTSQYNTIDNLLNPSWPKCYELEVVSTGEIINVCTDSQGDLDINLNHTLYKEKGIIKIKEGTTIECRNFRVHNDNQYGQGMQLVCDGSIVCTEEFRIDDIAQNNDQSPYFSTSCSAKITANHMYIGYGYAIQPFKGIWLTETMIIKNGQGQDIDFPDCSYVKASEIEIDANVSNGIIIEGHVVSDKIKSSKDIYLKYNGIDAENPAILTLGSLEGYHSWNNVKIVADSYTTVNLCSNPTIGDGTTFKNNWFDEPVGADRIGYFRGSVLYNYGAGGWDASIKNKDGKMWTPVDEWDINPELNQYGGTDGTYNSTNFKAIPVPAYASYADCINESPIFLLPIELIEFYYLDGIFEWETASETNNNYFVVEYSKNGKDWIECSHHIASISSDGADYSCLPTINVVNSVFSYFRLKQVDNDGIYSYSNVVTIYNGINSSPCDSGEKITIEGIQYRIYNGQLYYCEGDNE